MHSDQFDDASSTSEAVYVDPDTFEQEQERIFRGPTWNYLGLAEDVSEVGAFVTSDLGRTPVVLNRGPDGLHAFVNRCAHQGALVVRQRRGRCDRHVCELHRWTYDHAGRLLNGAADNIGLQGLGVDAHRDIIFGTLDRDAPSLRAYLSDSASSRLDIPYRHPIKALSHHRRPIKANWKLYVDRLLASCAHFGIPPLYEQAARREHSGRYHSSWTTYHQRDGSGEFRSILERVELDGGTVPFFSENDDGTASIVIFVFPAFVVAKVENHLQLRHIVPKSADEFELVWTNLAYEGDSAEQIETRQTQGRLLGLASPLSLEDAQELEAAHEALKNELPADRETHGNQQHASRIASWRAYRDLMHDESPREC